jgi:hypothetical protein
MDTNKKLTEVNKKRRDKLQAPTSNILSHGSNTDQKITEGNEGGIELQAPGGKRKRAGLRGGFDAGARRTTPGAGVLPKHFENAP